MNELKIVRTVEKGDDINIRNLMNATPEGISGKITEADGQETSYSGKKAERTVKKRGFSVTQIITREGDQLFIEEKILDKDGNERPFTEKRIFDREMIQTSQKISDILNPKEHETQTSEVAQKHDKYETLLASGENPLEFVEVAQELIVDLQNLESQREDLIADIRYDLGLESRSQGGDASELPNDTLEDSSNLKSLESKLKTLKQNLIDVLRDSKRISNKLKTSISGAERAAFTEKVKKLQTDIKTVEDKIQDAKERVAEKRKKLKDINNAIEAVTKNPQIYSTSLEMEEELFTKSNYDIDSSKQLFENILDVTKRNFQARQNFSIQSYLKGIIKERTSENPVFNSIPQVVRELSSTITNGEEKQQMKFLLEKILLKNKSVEVLNSFSGSFDTLSTNEVIRDIINNPNALPHSNNDPLQAPKMIELINKVLSNEKALTLIGGKENVVLALNSIRDNYIKSLQAESISGYSEKPNREAVRKGLSLVKDSVSIATLTLDSIIKKNLVNSKYEYVDYIPNILELSEIINSIPEELQNEPIVAEIIELHKILSGTTPGDKSREDEVKNKVKELADKLNDFLSQSKVKYSMK